MTRPVENTLQRSLAIVGQQGALSYELRTAIDCVRFWRGSGRVAKPRTLLASVLGRFTEGFATADFLAARHLLDELA
jgi:predicted ATPase